MDGKKRTPRGAIRKGVRRTAIGKSTRLEAKEAPLRIGKKHESRPG